MWFRQLTNGDFASVREFFSRLGQGEGPTSLLLSGTLDRAAVGAGLTRPYHSGCAEGVNARTKRIKRQMHGRAGFPCSATASSSSDHCTALPPTTGQSRTFYSPEPGFHSCG